MKKRFILIPFLFAVYPIFHLYSYNVQELVLSQIYLPTIISLTLTFILWFFLSLITRDKIKAAIIATVFIISFFSYGYIFNALSSLDLFYLKHRHIFVIILFLAGYIGYFINRIKEKTTIENIGKILIVLVVVLISINLIRAIPYEIRKLYFRTKRIAPETIKMNPTLTSNLPDIYYIILDEYASLGTIKNIWHYDNSKFADALKKMGFYIADKCSWRYLSTVRSLASSLNMQYVDLQDKDFLSLQQMISNSQVIDFLKKRGYTIVAFENRWTLNKSEMNADYNLYYSRDKELANMQEAIMGNIDEFSILLLQYTMVKPFMYLVEWRYLIGDSKRNARNQVLYSFYKLKNIDDIPTPKFVFAHIICPHTPFVFAKNGREVDPYYSHNWRKKQYYLEQYIFVSTQIERLVEVILKNSVVPPIIIIQSDHGPRGASGKRLNRDFVLEIAEIEKHKIFNAYYLPGFDQEKLYPTITPVNTFRLIFNHYFDKNMELVDDCYE